MRGEEDQERGGDAPSGNGKEKRIYGKAKGL